MINPTAFKYLLLVDGDANFNHLHSVSPLPGAMLSGRGEAQGKFEVQSIRAIKKPSKLTGSVPTKRAFVEL